MVRTVFFKAKFCLFTTLISLSYFGPALATIHIHDDYGGVIREYLEKYDLLAKSHERVIIDGICDSACTLVLKLPKNQVCITKNGKLGFHQAFDKETKEPAPDSTALMLHYYPDSVRTWIDDHGGLGREIKRMTALDLRKIVRRCSE